MSTRAIRFLKQKGVAFEVIKYDHHVKGVEFAAQATGFPLHQTVKTLVVDLGQKRYLLALLPGDRQLSLKRLARLLKRRRTGLADQATAERLTGYLVGGISPFGTRRQMPVVMEASLEGLAQVLINAGQRGVMLKLAPADIRQALDCRVAPIAKQ